MSEQQAPAEGRPVHNVNWSRRLAIGGIALVAAVVLSLILSAFLPRWWAVRVGNQVNQSTFNGVALGLFYGIVFTFLPLLVLWLGFRKRRPWKHWAAFLVGAALLAFPNLMTLSIVVGNGNAAHAGERILDTEASYFRASTAIGAAVAVLLFLFVIWLVIRRRSLDRRSNRLNQERQTLERERTGGGEPKG